MRKLAIALVLICQPAMAQDIGLPLPPLAIQPPGPQSTTDYYDAQGNYLGQSQTNTQQPYPRQPTYTMPDYRRHMVPNGYERQR